MLLVILQLLMLVPVETFLDVMHDVRGGDVIHHVEYDGLVPLLGSQASAYLLEIDNLR